MRRRVIPRLLIALTLSALTTIAIAWSLACTNILVQGVGSAQVIHPTRGKIHFDPVGGPANGLKVCGFVATGRVSIFAACQGPDFPIVVGSAAYFYQSVPTPPDELVPRSLRPITIPWLVDPASTLWPRGSDMDWRNIEASGFPLLALASIDVRTKSFTREHTWSLPLPGNRLRRFGETAWGPSSTCVLPLRPLFPGFLFNTLAAAPLWYTLLLIPGALRRAIRKRRNQCPHCAYSRTGLAPNTPCPECGHFAHRNPRPTNP